MRSLDQIYWDACCDDRCNCNNLEEALVTHPDLKEWRDGPAVKEAR